jgi:Protein of unknown function (DUF3662)/FHA domain
MSLAQRFERRLESLVGSAFARVFKGQVEPVEIGSALQREATDKRNVMGNGEVLAPNRYRVTLSPSDHDRLVPWEVQLTNSLAELLQEHLDENGWRTIGDIEVYLSRDDALHTGVFGVASRMESSAPPRRRPYDSLSLPPVPGHPPNDYQQPYGAPPPQPYGAPPQGPPPSDQPYRPPIPSQIPSPNPSGRPVAPSPAAGMAAAGAAAISAPGLQQHALPPFLPQQSSSLARDPHASSGYAAAPQQRPGPAPQPYGTPHARASVMVDGTNRQHELRIGSNIVGRGTESHLQLLDQGVSRRHLDIQYDGNFATVYDLGSTNGTNVNGRDVRSQLLRHGDVIRLGHSRLVYQQQENG